MARDDGCPGAGAIFEELDGDALARRRIGQTRPLPRVVDETLLAGAVDLAHREGGAATAGTPRSTACTGSRRDDARDIRGGGAGASRRAGAVRYGWTRSPAAAAPGPRRRPARRAGPPAHRPAGP